MIRALIDRIWRRPAPSPAFVSLEQYAADYMRFVEVVEGALDTQNEALKAAGRELAALRLIVSSSIMLMSASPDLVALLRAKALEFRPNGMSDEECHEVRIRVELLLASEVPRSISWQ